MKMRLFIFIIFICFIKISFAKIIYIPEEYQSILLGISVAADGDTVLVSPGTYNVSFGFHSKKITVASMFLLTGDVSYIKQTIITYPSFMMLKFDGGETKSTILEGFTINGSNVAIYCSNNSNPTLKNLNITNCSANCFGAGVYCDHASPTIINCTFANNILLEPTVHGSAILATNNSHPIIINSIVWKNRDPQISLWHSGDTQPSSVTIAYSNIEGGKQAIEIADGTVNWLQGNSEENPLFQDEGQRDYLLQSASPCIDKGTALFVSGTDTLINIDPSQYEGSAPDMGAFEYKLISAITTRYKKYPKDFSLEQNYPNPFNPSTTIKFNLSHSCFVNLKIYNLAGQEIETLFDGYQTAGEHQVQWIAEGLPGGLYFYRLQAGEFYEVKKFVLQK